MADGAAAVCVAFQGYQLQLLLPVFYRPRVIQGFPGELSAGWWCGLSSLRSFRKIFCAVPWTCRFLRLAHKHTLFGVPLENFSNSRYRGCRFVIFRRIFCSTQLLVVVLLLKEFALKFHHQHRHQGPDGCMSTEVLQGGNLWKLLITPPIAHPTHSSAALNHLPRSR